jgi:hypothetical protein
MMAVIGEYIINAMGPTPWLIGQFDICTRCIYCAIGFETLEQALSKIDEIDPDELNAELLEYYEDYMDPWYEQWGMPSEVYLPFKK